MTFTPVEIRHVKPARSVIGGYKRDAVDAVLEEIISSFEDVWRERADLADKVEQLEADLVRFRELEGLLRTTLVSAEKAAVTLKEQARKEAGPDRRRGAQRGAVDHAERARRPRPAPHRDPPDEVPAPFGARARRRRTTRREHRGRSRVGR